VTSVYKFLSIYSSCIEAAPIQNSSSIVGGLAFKIIFIFDNSNLGIVTH